MDTTMINRGVVPEIRLLLVVALAGGIGSTVRLLRVIPRTIASILISIWAYWVMRKLRDLSSAA